MVRMRNFKYDLKFKDKIITDNQRIRSKHERVMLQCIGTL